MRSSHNCCFLFFILFLLAFSTSLRADTTLVKFGSVWKFLDKGVAAPVGKEAADWRSISFNDAAWKSGPAELGYGANKERTTVNYGANAEHKYVTTYFRQVITLNAIAVYSMLQINAYIDDGAVLYVNGKEVARVNIAGTPGYTTFAANAS